MGLYGFRAEGGVQVLIASLLFSVQGLGLLGGTIVGNVEGSIEATHERSGHGKAYAQKKA